MLPNESCFKAGEIIVFREYSEGGKFCVTGLPEVMSSISASLPAFRQDISAHCMFVRVNINNPCITCLVKFVLELGNTGLSTRAVKTKSWNSKYYTPESCEVQYIVGNNF